MVTAATLKFIFALTIFLISAIAGWYPFKKRLKYKEHVDFPIGETLATGVFLGAALLHMLPESNHIFQTMGYDYPLAYIITGSVFLFFLWFEHLGEELYHQQNHQHPSFAILAWIMLSVHSVMVGAALGLSQHHSLVIMIFLAIIAHKWAESFAIAVQLNKSSLNQNKRFFLFLIFTLMTPAGIFLGWYSGRDLQTDSLFDPILIAASAGTFLYLGTLHGLERCVMVERCCNLKDFSYVIIGFLLMASVAVYV
ncbi:zinc transporter [Legionella israelensis]|uniref:Zinc transporter n=1 Tax=Legionella israelensis TaxID=454 RepID=A0A0W0WNJ1_9GAMM|nr:ZIP family metal transporter [Legionella israelensis]KTD33867.1 Zip family transporter [Legionella israelensis]QBR83593.1 zinc transporter [Legionella israelensis]QBS08966.1 zinc transporter [Legionella israelensis]QDP73226.1 zinc transporter [Legionella israelensis]SCX81493.1 Zinc transporter ZupT [Legionella israelensis DSM 19235]